MFSFDTQNTYHLFHAHKSNQHWEWNTHQRAKNEKLNYIGVFFLVSWFPCKSLTVWCVVSNELNSFFSKKKTRTSKICNKTLLPMMMMMLMGFGNLSVWKVHMQHLWNPNKAMQSKENQRRTQKKSSKMWYMHIVIAGKPLAGLSRIFTTYMFWMILVGFSLLALYIP